MATTTSLPCCRFVDRSHVEYYGARRCTSAPFTVSCGVQKNKVKVLSGGMSAKKKLKLLDELSKDLSFVANAPSATLGDSTVPIVDSVRGEILSASILSYFMKGALETLRIQLEQVRAQEKETKKKRKAEKKALKAARKMEKDNSESSSSEDSDCEVLNMKKFHPEVGQKLNAQGIINTAETNAPSVAGFLPQFVLEHLPQSQFQIPENAINLNRQDLPQTIKEEVKNRIEVCMGGKCRRAGSPEILGQIQKSIQTSNLEGDVEAVGCKCMGKCKNAPNLRVHSADEPQKLHLGVGFDDIEFILSNKSGVTSQPNLINV